MWKKEKNFPAGGFYTPPPTWHSNRQAPVMPRSERKRNSPQGQGDAVDIFHVIHKVPPGDSPYGRAKHVQLVDKDPSRAISLFWAAINSGDRVDSALKDMAVVMKQLNRSDEAIEAIKSFRHLCPFESQESLDNVLVELYKRSGRIEEQIEMLQVKLKHIEEGIAFGGRRTKPARSQGKKVQITIEQEYSRLLGNLAWAYLQQNNYKSAEELYRKALSLEQDKNKQCNLAICLMYMNKMSEAKFLLEVIRSSENGYMDETYAKSFDRATQILAQLESQSCEETRIPFSSLISINSEEFPIPSNGSQNHNSGFAVSRKLADGDDKKTVQLDEQKKGFCFSNHCKNDNNFSGSDKENSKCASSGPRNGLQSSPKNFLADKLRRGSYEESFYNRRNGFGSKRNDNGASVAGVEAGYTFMKEYASPIPSGGSSTVPFTQPRRGSYKFDYRDQRSAWEQEDAVTGCNRKLSFIIGIGERERKSEKIDCEEILDSKAFRVPAASFGYINASETFFDEDYDQGSNITAVDRVRVVAPVEQIEGNPKETKELQSQCQPVRRNLEVCQDFSFSVSKKSRPYMIEEEEKKLPSGKSDCPEHLPFLQTPTKKYCDENINCNVIFGSLVQLNQTENLSEKMESLNLKDGYHSQPGNADLSMNREVRHSLCFDQQHKPDGEEKFCSSPLLKKDFNFDSYSSVVANEIKYTSGNGTNFSRNRRLQVFQDITLCESPRN